MPSEWYNERSSVTLEEKEIELIEKGLPQFSSIIFSAFGNLEDYDQDGGEVTIYNNVNQSTGVKITNAIYGDPQFQGGTNKQEQLQRITINGEYVTILLNPDNTLKEIQTNIKRENPYSLYKWLNNAYSLINHLLNNPRECYFGELEEFRYYGEEETRSIRDS